MLFRVWCKNKNEWETDSCSIDAYGRILDGWTTVKPETHIVEFSTGIKDANGKEIFQGDIIEGTTHYRWSHDVIRCEVVWNEASARFECRQYRQRVLGKFWSHTVKFSKDVKVIGNIHENKNLLGMDEKGNYAIQSLGRADGNGMVFYEDSSAYDTPLDRIEYSALIIANKE